MGCSHEKYNPPTAQQVAPRASVKSGANAQSFDATKAEKIEDIINFMQVPHVMLPAANTLSETCVRSASMPLRRQKCKAWA